MAKKNEEFSNEIDQLIQKGREQGFVTQEEILAKFPDAEENVDKVDDLYATLQEQGIEIVDAREKMIWGNTP